MEQESLKKRNRSEALILLAERLLQELERGFNPQFAYNHRQCIKTLIQQLSEFLAQDDDQKIDQSYNNLKFALRLDPWDQHEDEPWESDDDISGGSTAIPNPRKPSPKPGTNDSEELPPIDNTFY
ncbi:MAG: hypothetical protein RMZ41_009395 [Nostoc sp. DedVER02]|uniref:hypothetical protein n=1 Tax=unclassified Nostoc TaxID=2593658 RepID=UPI002AD3233C|nr:MULTISPECIES: hypothetical protein [unclassified Nostoc]MDZ7985603.1 hypothetical protein [Nostoc sp. DedVER02]MDZ8113035.1 hypothetical protein [Nostoc sp. DedVER01b]